MAKVEKTMFRKYDVRGRVNDQELNEQSAELIGKGFARFLEKRGVKSIVVGYDLREYSERLKNALVKGLLASDMKVTEVGRVLSPILYFAQYHLKLRGNVMVTASHNPNGWSGFKLGYDFATTLLPSDIEELYKIIESDDFISGKGKIKKYKNIVQDYTHYVLSKIKIKRKMKVVVNCGNGTAGAIAPDILRKAGLEVVEQFCDLDWNFPHHEPNPSLVEAQQALAAKVKKVGAEVGLGYDGDGDRVGFCDEKGQVVFPDQALILMARQALKEKPGAAIVFDVKATQALVEDVKAHGGRPVMWMTGHSYIKQKSKEVDAALAGEGSGHIFYRYGYYGYDDAIFSSLKFLEYLSSQNETFSALMKTTPQYVKEPTIHVECGDEIKYQVLDKLVKELKREYGDQVIDIDGARVHFDDGWFLVRASSNLPVLVLGFEAKTKERLEELKKILRERLDKHPEIGKEWRSG